MNLFRLFKARQDSSAPVARERLQILLAHERKRLGSEQDLLAKLRDELVATILRHVDIDPGKVMVKLDGDTSISTLEIDIEIPRDKIVGDGRRAPLSPRLTPAA